jgi:hypothetical protein
MRVLISAAAERIGLCPAELLAIELVSVMPADEATTVVWMSRILGEEPRDCRDAVKSCLQQAWLEALATGLLRVTDEGQKFLSEQEPTIRPTVAFSVVRQSNSHQ